MPAFPAARHTSALKKYWISVCFASSISFSSSSETLRVHFDPCSARDSSDEDVRSCKDTTEVIGVEGGNEANFRVDAGATNFGLIFIFSIFEISFGQSGLVSDVPCLGYP